MTLVEIDELLMPHLAEHPPTHIMVAMIAGALGWKPKRAGTAPSAPTPSQIAELSAVGLPMTDLDVHAGLPMPVLDFAALKARGNA